MNALTANASAAPTGPAVSEETLVEHYFTQLARLSPDARLELAARLLQTLKSSAPSGGEPTPSNLASEKTLLNFAGAWADDPEADKMEEAIRSARNFTRPEISLELNE